MFRKLARWLLAAFTLIELLVVIAIIAIMAGLLMPALASAREKARRAACIGQLDQMAVALESYCADYGQYYPSSTIYNTSFVGVSRWPYNASHAKVPFDDGYYIDPRIFTGNWNPAVNNGYDRGRVRVNATAYGNSALQDYFVTGGQYWVYETPIARLRTIFAGDRGLSNVRGSTSNDDPTHRPVPNPGELSMAPVGLGFLVVGGYAADARLFYCPSAGGSMPVPIWRWQYWEPPEPDRLDAVCATSVKDLQRAGGYDAKSMLTGDWSWLRIWSRYSFVGRAVACDYAYRNMTVTVGYRNPVWNPAYGTSLVHPNAQGWIKGTRPQVQFQVGAPPFKTQKILGGRAIVADSFGNHFNETNYYSWGKLRPGDGWYAHRDGYNVLYGDGHVKWYGDPENRFVWWPPTVANRADMQPAMYSAGGTGTSHMLWYRKIDGTEDGTYSDHKTSSAYAWHLLDVAGGLDAGVDE